MLLVETDHRFVADKPMSIYFDIAITRSLVVDLMARLAALVPPPRMHLTRYHGVFAPHSSLRAAITPARRGKGKKNTEGDGDHPATPRPVAMSWAQRLKRVFGIEIETCAQWNYGSGVGSLVAGVRIDGVAGDSWVAGYSRAGQGLICGSRRAAQCIRYGLPASSQQLAAPTRGV